MLSQEEIDAFKNEWYTYEEIQRVEESLKHFEENWEAYDMEEAFEMVNKKVFSKYMTNV